MIDVLKNKTHIGNLTIIGSDNGLSPGQRQAITWTKVGILLIGPLATNFSEMLIEIPTFSFKEIHMKMSGKWRPFCVGLNVLKHELGGHFNIKKLSYQYTEYHVGDYKNPLYFVVVDPQLLQMCNTSELQFILLFSTK